MRHIHAQLGTDARSVSDCNRLSVARGEHITEQTAADLDLIRHVGGTSGPATTGPRAGRGSARCATYSPGSVGRFVLDSNTGFPGTWQQLSAWQPTAFERRWREAPLAWKTRCDELCGLGSTVDGVLASYEDSRARLKADPAPTPDGAFVDHAVLDAFAIGSACGKVAFPGFAGTVAALRTAEPVGAQTSIGDLVDRPADAHAASPAPPADATCGKPGGDVLLAKRQRLPVPRRAGRGGGALRRAGPGGAGHAHPDGAGVPPVLVLQSEPDPATAAEGARIAHERFQGSHLVTVTGEGDQGSTRPGTPASTTSSNPTPSTAWYPLKTSPAWGGPARPDGGASRIRAVDAAQLTARTRGRGRLSRASGGGARGR